MRRLPVKGRAAAFAAAVCTAANLRKIVNRSQAFAGRLVNYVRTAVNPAAGDTLMLVDLGYNGTVQDKIEPLLSRALGVEVAGRYLLLREQKLSRRDKRGMIDGRHYAPTTLEAFCSSVAVVEQLCTAAQGSVVDYDAAGRPVRAGNSIKSRQSDVRDKVQQGCVRFAVERDAAFVSPPISDTQETRRRSAAAVLARLMFLPLPGELDVLQSFEHDVNLGSAGTVKLFDAELAARGLKRRGLFYMKGSERMYLPAELRGQGLPASLALLTQHRFGLDLKYADFSDRTIELPIIVADGNNVLVDRVEAHPTHDGWFMTAIPIGACRYAIGVQFGRLYQWVQVESAQFVPVRTFLTDKEARSGEPINALPSLEGMEQVAPHLMRCDEESAFLMVPPPALATPEPMMLTVVFRPIAEREPVEFARGPSVAAGAVG